MSEDRDDLLARIERLEAELRELRTGARPPIATNAPGEARTAPTSRRQAVGLLAAGAVGAVAAAVGSQSAAAANGDAVFLANVNTSTAPTVLNSDLSAYSSASFETAAVSVDAAGRGYGIDAEGSWGNALFRASGNAPTPANARRAGIVWVDGNGNWWVSVGKSSWRRIAGPNTGGFTPLAVPTRVYDTRKDKATVPGFKVPFQPGETREIDLTAAGSGVPTTATAVQISFAVIFPPKPGYALAWPGGTKPNVSQVNYLGGGVDVKAACVAIGATNGRVSLFSLGGGDIAFDVYGYFS